MSTLTRPRPRMRSRSRLAPLGDGLIAAGFVVMTLGILEIGGLFNIGFGLMMSCVGCVLSFGPEDEGLAEVEEAFRRELDGL